MIRTGKSLDFIVASAMDVLSERNQRPMCFNRASSNTNGRQDHVIVVKEGDEIKGTIQHMSKEPMQTSTDSPKNRSVWFIALRFLVNPQGKLAGRHWLTVIGIALGVFALLSVSSVMNGFDKDMRQRIIGTRSEIKLKNRDASPLRDYEAILTFLRSRKYVTAAAPLVRNELILVNGSYMTGTVCFGIDLREQVRLSPVLRPIDADLLNDSSTGWLQGLVNRHIDEETFNDNGIILGYDLAQIIGASIGDEITLISPTSKVPTPLGMLPKTKSVRVVGIFVAGMPEYDRLYSYINLRNGQFFSGYTDEIDDIQIKSSNQRHLFRTTAQLQRDFPHMKVENWSSFDRNLYQAMHFEKFLMLVVLGLMFIIAAFSMSGNILRTVVQKRRSIGILKALGYNDKQLISVFLKQGLCITLVGIVAGILLSFIILFTQMQLAVIRIPMGTLPPLVLPVDIRLTDYLMIPLIAFLISVLSIYIPARSVVGIDPIKLIREIV